jgi:hypothetical protein
MISFMKLFWMSCMRLGQKAAYEAFAILMD